MIALFPNVSANPSDISVGTKLKYTVELESGKLAGPSVFEADMCYRLFNEIGLSHGKMLFEIYLAPIVPSLKGISLNNSEVTINSKYAKPLSWACVSANNISVELEVIEKKDRYVVVNYTVILSDFIAITDNNNYKVFKGLLGTPTVVRERDVAWIYKTYSFSRLLGVKEDTNEVIDLANGIGLGEWIFWLHPKDKSAKLSILLGINYAVPYIYRNGIGFNAVLMLVNSNEIDNTDYSVTVGGTNIIINRKDTIVGHSVPFFIVNIRSTNTPSPAVTRLLQKYGCNVNKEAGIVEVSCTELIQAYENARSHKPWAINLLEKKYNGMFTKVLEVVYRRTKLIPFPIDVYKSVYWRGSGILLFIGEDMSIQGEPQGFAPPPLTSYITWNKSAVVFKSLKAPVSLKLIYASISTLRSTSEGSIILPEESLSIYSYISLAGLFVALVIVPATISVKRSHS